MSSKESAMFACTKCNSRHPFDELSQGQQLCKECRGSYPVVKCTYCRSEFQQVNKKNTDTICKKCALNIKNYGMPKPCEYCSVIAAFIGTKCQKCSNSEKKYGSPHTCEQCKQKCAFDRKNERKKVDGKLLCWLCTLSYKRVLQKAQKRKFDFINRNNSSPSNSPHSQHNTPLQNHQDKDKTKEKERRRLQQREEKDHGRGDRDKNDDHRGSKSRSKTGSGQSESSEKKKSKLDLTSTNGDFLSGTMSTSSRLIDTGLPDQVVEVTRLREQVAQLKKSLDEKDRQMFEKEKKLTEMKAEQFRMENEMRSKVSQSQKQNEDIISDMQARNRELQKQVSQLSRNQRPTAPSTTQQQQSQLPPSTT
ncbi:hypothetical protein BSL78_04524 [Apostichopus japonicus]|uniref:Protein FAM76A n=1 Tax=Stichopus japonicus TaxID=307972 RepID=A0A2G8LE66_STIJA|nr:hypothetical protein BSL78_04524 [Apostichopus japonicus]